MSDDELLKFSEQFMGSVVAGKTAGHITIEQGVVKGMGQAGAMHYGLDEGRGKMHTLTRNQLGVASPAIAAGHVQDADLATFMGVGSSIGRGAPSAGTTFKKLDRLVNEGTGHYKQTEGRQRLAVAWTAADGQPQSQKKTDTAGSGRRDSL